jgi:hypothetical protein
MNYWNMKEKRKLAPCDCIDINTAERLQERGISFNNRGISITPNYVELTMDHTTVKISMSTFKKFAQWYLEPQELKDGIASYGENFNLNTTSK